MSLALRQPGWDEAGKKTRWGVAPPGVPHVQREGGRCS